MEVHKVDYSRKWLVLIAVGMGVFLSTIDGIIVNIALNTLVKELGKPLAVIEWVILAYMLTISTLMISAGKLGDILGKKKLFLAGLVIFTIGSTLCGLSPTVYWLIGFRVLQAVGAALMMALGMALVTEAFPASERGKALGIMGTVVSIGIITGPTIGGIILESLSWHWLFFVNLPLGILGVFLVARFVPQNIPAGKQRFDFPGAGLLFVCLIAMLGGLSLGQQRGFYTPGVFILLALFLSTLALFIIVEKRSAEPMIDLSMFRKRLFSINLVTGFLAFVVSAGTMLIIPLYLQNVLAYSPRSTGLMMAITPVTVAIVAPLSGALSDRIGSRIITTLGLLLIFIGHIAVSTLSADTTTLGYLIRFIPVGIGIGMFQSPNNSAIMGSVPRERMGVASSLLSLTRTIGQISGIAILGAFWESRVRVIASGIEFSDSTTAPIAAQVQGLQQTIYLDIVIIFAALALSSWALIYWLRQKEKTTPDLQIPAV